MHERIKHYPSDLPFPFSKAIEVNGILYLSGQVSMAADATPMRGSVFDQTNLVMRNISAVLEGLEATLDDVFKVTVWLSDMKSFSEFNNAYAAFFSENYPARSVVCAKLAFDLDVEIEVQAVAPKRL